MSTKIPNILKKPTKNYTLVLEEIGKSEKPSSSYQIRNRIRGSGDIYRIIQVLCPSNPRPQEIEREMLFRWEEILKGKNDGKYKKNLVEKIKKSLKLEAELPLHNTNDSEVDIENDNLSIRIEGKDDIVVIDVAKIFGIILLKSEDHILVRVKDKDKTIKDATFKTKKNIRNKMTEAFTTKSLEPGPRYLNVTLNENAQRKIYEIQEKEKAKLKYQQRPDLLQEYTLDELPEVRRIADDRRNWRYSLNIRGLLKYLIEMSKENRKHTIRISKVLSNPSLLKEAPFLVDWKFFEKAGLNIVYALLKYSQNLETVLEERYYEDEDLRYFLGERYFVYVSGMFSLSEFYWSLDHNMKTEEFESRLRNFRVSVLGLLRDYCSHKRDFFEESIKYYTKK